MISRRFLSHINVLNIVLAVLLGFAAQRTLMPFVSGSVKIQLPAPAKQAAAKPAEAAGQAEVKSPSPADYMVIAEQNLFHPERKIPVEKKEAAAPLPKPEFVLYGTLKTDAVQVAYMEDLKQPVSTPTRGRKQVPLRLGDALSGFVLKEIEADRVVMQRGEERMVVLLNDANHPKAREVAGQTVQAPQPGHRPAVQPARPQPAPVAPVVQAQPAPATPALQAQPGTVSPQPARQPGRGGGLFRMGRP